MLLQTHSLATHAMLRREVATVLLSLILAMMLMGMMLPQANAQDTGLKIGATDTVLIMARIMASQTLGTVLRLAMRTVNVLGFTPNRAGARTGDRDPWMCTPILDIVVTARWAAHCLRPERRRPKRKTTTTNRAWA